MDQRSGDRGALHFAAAELSREVPGPMLHLHEAEDTIGSQFRFPAAAPLQQERKSHVFPDRHGGQQIEKLEDDAHVDPAVAGALRVRHGVERFSIDKNFAAGGSVEGPEQVQQSALSAATFPRYRGEGAAFQLQRNRLQGLHPFAAFRLKRAANVFQVDKHVSHLARLDDLRYDFLYNPDFKVIDETGDYVVVDKPPHLLVHPSRPGNPPTLLDGLEELLAFEVVNGARLSIINRLDRDTSGVVLVAKHHKAAREFSIAMQKRQFAKRYLALVFGWPDADTFTVNGPILRRGEVAPARIYLKRMVHPDGAPSETRFEVKSRFTARKRRLSLVEARPVTGRMHQIRVHLQHAGHSVVGDKIYGPSEDWYLDFIENGWTEQMEEALILPRHALHASSLALPERNLHWEAPLPEDLAGLLASGASSSPTPTSSSHV